MSRSRTDIQLVAEPVPQPEKIREVPIEVVRTVEVIREVKVEVPVCQKAQREDVLKPKRRLS